MKRGFTTHLVIWAIVLGLGAYLAGTLVHTRGAAQARARNTALTHARLVAEHAHASIRQVELILDDLAERLPRDALAQGTALPDIRRAALRDLLNTARGRMAGIENVILSDSVGMLTVTAIDPVPMVAIDDRTYFRTVREGAPGQTFLSDAVQGRVSGKWGLMVARRLEDASGRFLGLVAVNLGLDRQFIHFYRSLAPEGDAAIALWSHDWRLLTRYPVVEPEIGKAHLIESLAPLIDADLNETSTVAVSPVDRTVRLIALRRVEDYPLYASFAVAESDYMAQWRDQARDTMLAILALLVGGGVLSTLEVRSGRTAERVRRLIRETPLGLITLRAGAEGDLLLLQSNPAAHRILQTNLEPHAGERLVSLLPGLTGSPILERVRAVARQGQPWRASGLPYRDERLQALFDIVAFQVAPGVAGVMFDDVSEREAAVAALNARERDLRRAESLAQLGSWRLRLADRSMTCSDECLRILGARAGMPVSVSTFTALIHPDDRERVRAAWRNLLAGGRMDETYRIGREGRPTTWVRARAEHDPLPGDDITLLGTIQDITQQHEAEQRLKDSEDRFHQLFARHASIMLLIEPVSGAIVDANAAAAEFYGYAIETLVGMRIQDINALPPEDVERERQRAFKEQRNYFVFPHRLADGRLRTVEVYSPPIQAGGQTVLFSIMHDVTEKQLAESRLRLAAGVFDNAHEGIVVTDLSGTILEVNRAYCTLTGYEREDLIGRNPRILQAGPSDEAFYAEMWGHLGRRGFWRGDLHNRRKDGSYYLQETGITAVTNALGLRTHYIGFAEDVTLLRQSQQRLEYLAYHDALTQLPNRLLLADHIRLALAAARREGRHVAVCYLDLDEFKPVNDQWGHTVGDQLLVEVAGRLKACVRAEDTVARLGGDEFVILLASLDSRTEGEQALARVVAALSSPFQLTVGEIGVGASIGVSVFPPDDADADSLIRHADQAMYLAKQAGRNSIRFFDPDADRRARSLRDSVAEVALGLERGEFELYYQPQVHLRSGRVVGVEALLRWNHPQRGLLAPGGFLAEVDNTEVAVALGEWVLDTALRQADTWHRAGLELRVGINVSAHHLQQDTFAARLAERLSRHPELPAGRIELEILETAALEDLSRISRLMETCRRFGVSFALDDFGTGYASLAYLKHLPANLLKIDQSFIRDMLSDPEDHAIVQGIVGLAMAFRREVIAEGVESLAHGEALLALGCPLAQGYCIARPMPAAAVAPWVAHWCNPPEWSQPAPPEDRP
ncbi:MAG TPA: EAL domain-containing protein [Rhodocyclaceae bacterium]|uniref:EAL domain-containing protein n=1 Tax=Zoogloea sp. TaxID=49181 RepID=UPI002C269009|nr:EAL domain-containing protein [Zoogloea sp.]HNA66747.1 EAL domain-containing protein [Rhodocyclaceae bacterium]HNH17026.1 EAL domain-containing protein [Zoogloea sp.]